MVNYNIAHFVDIDSDGFVDLLLESDFNSAPVSLKSYINRDVNDTLFLKVDFNNGNGTDNTHSTVPAVGA